jgi:hypothetical protein
VSRRVDEIQLVELAVFRFVVEADRLGLDGDAALALDVHGIEHLLLHLPGREAAAELDQAVRQCRLAVVDMGNDRKIADVGEGCRRTHERLRRVATGRGSSLSMRQ